MGNSYTKEEYKLLKKYLEDSLGLHEKYTDESLYAIIMHSGFDPNIIKENIQPYLKKTYLKKKPKVYHYHKAIYKFLYKVSYDEIPLYINDLNIDVIAKWRLEIGK